MGFFAKLLPLAFLSVFAAACADGNALQWMADKDTSEGRQDKIDFAFIEGNCGLVIQMLAPHEGYLSAKQLYQYNNAILSCSGFNLVDSISVILNKDGGSNDPFKIIQSLMGTDNITADRVTELKDSYGKILKSCTGNIDENMKTVCGMTAAADTVLAVTDVALRLTGAESINATKEGLTEAVAGKTPDEITAAVEGSINEGAISLEELGKDLGLVLDASGVIADMAESNVDFSKDLEKFTDDIKDPSTGSITPSSLSSYIYSQFTSGNGGGSI